MKWLKRLLGRSASSDSNSVSSSGAKWLELDDPRNIFECRVVDLMCNLDLTSTTSDQSVAAKAGSWRPGQQRLIEPTSLGDGIPCNLRYRTKGKLPDGMLFVPRAMEDKWAVALCEGKVNFARSWTGETGFTARAKISDDELVLTHIFGDEQMLKSLGNPVEIIDWIVRSHVLDERQVMPVHKAGAEMLHTSPLMAMNLFGHRLFAAGIGRVMQKGDGFVHSLGDLSEAIYKNEIKKVESLVDDGMWSTAVATDGSPPPCFGFASWQK